MAPKKVHSEHGSKRKEQNSSEGSKTVQNKNGKKVLKKITTELRKEILEKHKHELV